MADEGSASQVARRVPMPIALALALAIGAPALVSADHAPVHGTVLARAAFVDPVDVKFKLTTHHGQEVVTVAGAQDTIVQVIDLQPGAFTGWHTHPGPAVAVISAGTLTLYDGEDPSCSPTPYPAGTAFVDPGQGHVHAARNEGTTLARVYVTYFDVPPGVGPTIQAADPGNCAG